MTEKVPSAIGEPRLDMGRGGAWARVHAWCGDAWRALSPPGRAAMAGVIASGMVAVALGLFIDSEIRGQLLDAEGRGLRSAVTAIEPDLRPMPRPPLTAAETDRLDRLVDRAILDSRRVRVKLWTLDGVVAYSDAHELIGRSFPDVRPRLMEASSRGIVSDVTDLDEPENDLERPRARLLEFYVPVQDAGGRVTGILEIYEDVAILDDALGRVSMMTWVAIGSGLGILLVFLVILMSATARSINRDRASAEARAAELAILVDATDALSSSLDPDVLLHRLESSMQRGLGMSRVAHEANEPKPVGEVGARLKDGSWLVAQRRDPPPSDEDARILKVVAGSLDVALANASLYSEVREAARQRQSLLARLADAHDEERRRIVGELHDSLAGDLIRVLYGIRGIAARAPMVQPEITAELVRLEELVVESERHLRALMARMRQVAPAHVGLDAALEEVVVRAREESGLDIRLRADPEPSLPPDTQVVLVRAAEEAVMNVRKHAAARRVLVRTSCRRGRCRLSVDDDGTGWTEGSPTDDGRGLGLAYLQERVAALGGSVVRSRSRIGGARLLVTIPLEAGA